MLCWLITFCTIARLWIVISWFVWMLWTREEVSLTDSAGIRERERERGTEGGSESERLGWHSRFANENEGRGRKWVWTTRSHSRFANENEGRREEVSLNDSLNHSPETRLNERTNERTNDSLWRTERRELIRGNESWNPSLLISPLGPGHWSNALCSSSGAPTRTVKKYGCSIRHVTHWFMHDRYEGVDLAFMA